MNKIELLKNMLINSSIGSSSVRNQGEGMSEAIRSKLDNEFSISGFINVLRAKNISAFEIYLNRLTDKVNGIWGLKKGIKTGDKVKWGTARKCINLVLRSVVYNGFIWNEYGLKKSDFKNTGIMNKLELPLDSYVLKGIKDDCRSYKLKFDTKKYPSFSIISLDSDLNFYYQSKAHDIARLKKVCRVDLDLEYWRKKRPLEIKDALST